ncbi:MAG: metal ABC transporter substrate-binding protein [Actinomycetota bacterium]|nr:metal ABC transporter substrate-binding protein [Actinomycetota bacterium]
MILSLSMNPRRRKAPIAALASLSLVAACGDDQAGDGSEESPSLVLATTSIWADVMNELTCDGEAGVAVEALMPPGVDPHQYEPSLQDRERLEGAGIVVANGAGLEAGADPLLESVDDDVLVTITELPGLALLEGSHEEEEEQEDHDDEGVDPHVWLDPTIVVASIDPLTDAVVGNAETDEGVDADAIIECADEYRQELEALDSEITDAIGTLPEDRRVLVTNHDAYGYFAQRYGFEIVGTVIPSTSTQAETNAADLADLAATIERHDVPAIFVDAGQTAAEAENLARSVDVEVVHLATDSLGGDSDDGVDSYVELMRSISAAVGDALDG